MAPAEWLRVSVAYSPRAGEVDEVQVELPVGATLADALRASGLVERHGLAWEGLSAGIWSKAKEPSTPLRERDRVELYRPLVVDPKEARRQRYARHRERFSGSPKR